MRAIFITLALAVVAVAGYFVYRNSAPPADEQPGLFAEQAPVELPGAEDCLTENAVYEYNDDRRLELRFRRMPATQNIEMAEMNGQRIGNMAFVVRVTSLSTDYVYTPVNQARGGPQYESAVTAFRPEGGGAPVQVYFFDSEMHYSWQLPRNDTPAPGYIFAPDILPRLYRDRIDQPAGVFRFQRCETPVAPATPTPTP